MGQPSFFFWFYYFRVLVYEHAEIDEMGSRGGMDGYVVEVATALLECSRIQGVPKIEA